MKRVTLFVVAVAMALTGFAQSKVYMTKEITPESLVKMYETLGVEAKGRVAVKISTGESQQSNHLRPEFIKDLVHKVNGTLVECINRQHGTHTVDYAAQIGLGSQKFELISID
jgi:hypothetical protein